MSNLAPCQGQVTSAPSTFGQRPSPMGARIAQRVERFSHPKEGDLLAFHFDQLALLVFQLIGRGYLDELGHRSLLLWGLADLRPPFLSTGRPRFAVISSCWCRPEPLGCRRRTAC